MKNLEITKFCSSSMAKLSQEIKRCQNSDCSGASMSHYALLPIEDQLADIYIQVRNYQYKMIYCT